jgi:hypothetical protein
MVMAVVGVAAEAVEEDAVVDEAENVEEVFIEVEDEEMIIGIILQEPQDGDHVLALTMMMNGISCLLNRDKEYMIFVTMLTAIITLVRTMPMKDQSIKYRVTMMQILFRIKSNFLHHHQPSRRISQMKVNPFEADRVEQVMPSLNNIVMEITTAEI